MKQIVRQGALTGTLVTFLACGVSLQAHAVALTGTIESGTNFSVVHTGANPGGTPPASEWYWFDADQQIDLDLSGDILSATGPQLFTLETTTGATGTLLLTDLWLDLAGADGFSGGHLSYELNGTTTGTFSFADHHYGSSPFNSSIIAGSVLSVFVWGGDAANNLGIDLAISAAVPEPGTLLLLVPGMAGLMAMRRRRSA